MKRELNLLTIPTKELAIKLNQFPYVFCIGLHPFSEHNLQTLPNNAIIDSFAVCLTDFSVSWLPYLHNNYDHFYIVCCNQKILFDENSFNKFMRGSPRFFFRSADGFFWNMIKYFGANKIPNFIHKDKISEVYLSKDDESYYCMTI